MCFLIASIAFGLGTVWLKRHVWGANPTVIAGWQVLIGSLPVLVIWLAIAPPLDPAAISGDAWLALLYLVVIANALAYFAWFRAVAVFPAVVSGIGAMAVPVVGVFSSALMVDERIGWPELAALALIIGALAINLFGNRPQAKPSVSDTDGV